MVEQITKVAAVEGTCPKCIVFPDGTSNPVVTEAGRSGGPRGRHGCMCDLRTTAALRLDLYRRELEEWLVVSPL